MNDGRHKPTIIGVVSFGAACAQEKSPAVFSKVDHVLGWIYETIRNYSNGTKEEEILKSEEEILENEGESLKSDEVILKNEEEILKYKAESLKNEKEGLKLTTKLI